MGEERRWPHHDFEAPGLASLSALIVANSGRHDPLSQGTHRAVKTLSEINWLQRSGVQIGLTVNKSCEASTKLHGAGFNAGKTGCAGADERYSPRKCNASVLR